MNCLPFKFRQEINSAAILCPPVSRHFPLQQSPPHGIFILQKHPLRFDCSPDKQGSLVGGSVPSGSRSAGVSQIYFSSQRWTRHSPQTPGGALANLSSPSVFHVAWGTLAGSPNELPPHPPPAPRPPPPPPAPLPVIATSHPLSVQHV